MLRALSVAGGCAVGCAVLYVCAAHHACQQHPQAHACGDAHLLHKEAGQPTAVQDKADSMPAHSHTQAHSEQRTCTKRVH
jgi:hypothetical protein